MVQDTNITSLEIECFFFIKTFKNASSLKDDVREITPEFYTLPKFHQILITLIWLKIRLTQGKSNNNK